MISDHFEECSFVSDNRKFVAQQSIAPEWLRVPHLRWTLKLSLLPFAKINKDECVVACLGELGELHAPKFSSFVSIEETHFLEGTHVHAASEKMTSFYPRNKFWSSARCFNEEFTSTVFECCSAFPAGSGPQLFLSRDNSGSRTIRPSFSSVSS